MNANFRSQFANKSIMSLLYRLFGRNKNHTNPMHDIHWYGIFSLMRKLHTNALKQFRLNINRLPFNGIRMETKH